MATMLETALEYEKRGWSVIQLKSRDKAPRIDWQEFQSRCATPDEIKQWWLEYPLGNVGIVCGEVSGIVVIDIDDIDKADKRILTEMPTGYQVKTGGGNRHAYFKLPPDVRIASRRLLGIELKGEGSQVVAPPSIHPSGESYILNQDGELRELPKWFLNILQGDENKIPDESNNYEKSVDWVATYWDGLSEGERNVAATKLAGYYIGSGLKKDEVVTILNAWNRFNKPPLPEKEILIVINSIEAKHRRDNPVDDDITIHFDKDAEQAVLGIIIDNNALIPMALEILGQDENVFVLSAHRIIYKAILEMTGNVDQITLVAKLREQHNLPQAGNIIPQLVRQTYDHDSLGDYCGIVRRMATKRQLVSAGKKISIIPNEDIDTAEMLSKAQNMVLSVSGVVAERKGIREQCDEAYAKLKSRGDNFIEIPTGFSNFDYLTGGLQKKQYYVIAGHTGVGKSAYCQNMLYNISVRNNIPTVLFCYESNATAIITRMVSLSTGVDLTYGLQPGDEMQVLKSVTNISRSPLIIIDDCSSSVEVAVASSQRLKAEHPDLAVAVYDHLHLMTADVRNGTKEQIVGAVSNTLKNIGKQLDIAVIGVSQLSRASIRRQDQRPMLDDLRWSGDIEAGADFVGFIYRDDYYEPETPSPVSPTELIVRKNKDGELGVLQYNYHRKYSKFDEV